MSPRFVLGRENVPCVAEVVNRSLKADCMDFSMAGRCLLSKDLHNLFRIKTLHFSSGIQAEKWSALSLTVGFFLKKIGFLSIPVGRGTYLSMFSHFCCFQKTSCQNVTLLGFNSSSSLANISYYDDSHKIEK